MFARACDSLQTGPYNKRTTSYRRRKQYAWTGQTRRLWRPRRTSQRTWRSRRTSQRPRRPWIWWAPSQTAHAAPASPHGWRLAPALPQQRLLRLLFPRNRGNQHPGCRSGGHILKQTGFANHEPRFYRGKLSRRETRGGDPARKREPPPTACDFLLSRTEIL